MYADIGVLAMKRDPFRLARHLLSVASRSPLVVFGGAALVTWVGSILLNTDWRTSHPRTISDAQVLKSFKGKGRHNVNVGLYGDKPVFRKIDDPVAGSIRNPPGYKADK